MDLRHLLPVLLLLLASGQAAAADPAALWSAQVQPLLDRHCVKCHGPIEKHGGLELDTPAAVLAGGMAAPWSWQVSPSRAGSP